MRRVNESLFGVCTNDVLFGLSSDEVSHNIEGNRMMRLATHLLQQRSFCPQFPVPTNVLSQLDLRQARHWEMKVNPDLLILPSRLAPLAKEVLGTVIVNPSSLAKGNSGGTFAEIAIHPLPEKTLQDAVKDGVRDLEHNIGPRTTVNIVKI